MWCWGGQLVMIGKIITEKSFCRETVVNSALHILVYLMSVNTCKGLLCSQSFFSWSVRNQNRFSLMTQPVWLSFFNFFARWPSNFCCAWHWLYSSQRKTLFTCYIFVFLLTSGISFPEALVLFHSKWSKAL